MIVCPSLATAPIASPFLAGDCHRRRGEAIRASRMRLALRAGTAAGAQIHRAIREGEAQGSGAGAFDQAEVAAVGTHELGGDDKAKPSAPRTGRALESFKQMRLRLLGKS